MGAIQQLALDLEEGGADLAQVQDLASKLPPDEAHQSEVSSSLVDAIAAYEAREPRRAWAAATLAADVAKAWIDRPTRIWPRRIALREFSLEVRGRALALLSLIEADAGHENAAAALSQESEAALQEKKLSSTSARFSVAAMAADRALRLRDTDKALAIIEQALRLPSLTNQQRAVGLALRATALRAAGRLSEADGTWQQTAESFRKAAQPAAALAADLERALQMVQSGDLNAARSMLLEVARRAATTGDSAVEARAEIQLGAIVGDLKEHADAAKHFERAAIAARRAGDNSVLVVALRNAADELRHMRDFPQAEQMLSKALAVPGTPALTVDLAKAKYYLAVLRHDEGKVEDTDRLLNEAAADLQARLTELAVDGSDVARQHVQDQLDKVSSLRQRLSRLGA